MARHSHLYIVNTYSLFPQKGKHRCRKGFATKRHIENVNLFTHIYNQSDKSMF
jgi:hypothetical protein